MAQKISTGVINTFQASGADASIAKGKVALSATTLTNNPLIGAISPVSYASVESYTKTLYSAGVASVKHYDYEGVTTANVAHAVNVTHNGVSKSYSTAKATAYAAAGDLVDELVVKVNGDSTSAVTASKISLGEVSTVTTVADVAGSLNDTYFLLSGGNGTDYYVWYNINSAGTDPSLAGKTGIEVAGATGASANTLATATASAIDAIGEFSAPAPGANVVTITNATSDQVTDIADGASPTGFTFDTTTQGTAVALRLTLKSTEVANGDFTVSANTSNFETIETAYVAPSGTEALVNKEVPGAAVAGGEYTKYSIVWNKLVSHNAVSGLKVYREVETVIYAEETGANHGAVTTNYDAFVVEMDSILDASYIAAIGDVADYVGR